MLKSILLIRAKKEVNYLKKLKIQPKDKKLFTYCLCVSLILSVGIILKTENDKGQKQNIIQEVKKVDRKNVIDANILVYHLKDDGGNDLVASAIRKPDNTYTNK